MKPYLFGRKVQTYFGGNILHALFTGTSNMKTKSLIDLFLSRFIGGSRVTLAVGRCSMSKPWEFQLTQSFYSDFFLRYDLMGKSFNGSTKKSPHKVLSHFALHELFGFLKRASQCKCDFFMLGFRLMLGAVTHVLL